MANITFMTPDMFAADTAALIAANTDAVSLNNEANAARERGDLNAAIRMHHEALQLKIRAYGTESIQAALSFNALGESYLRAGRIEEAEEALRKAMRVRDNKEFGGLGVGPRMDAAVTRDNMGQVFEVQGKFAEAKEIRMKGANRGETVCGNYECTKETLSKKEIKTCGACRSVFYCSTACQKRDWSQRHKVLCKKFTASRGSAVKV